MIFKQIYPKDLMRRSSEALVIILSIGIIVFYNLQPTGQQVAGNAPQDTQPAVLQKPVMAFSSQGNIDVIFSWQRAGAVEEQWLDLSIFDNNFAEGTFINTKLDYDATSYKTGTGAIGPLDVCTRHYWRINTFVDGQWWPSLTGSFDTPCKCGRPCALGDGVGIFDIGDNCISIKEFYDEKRCCFNADCSEGEACSEGRCKVV